MERGSFVPLQGTEILINRILALSGVQGENNVQVLIPSVAFSRRDRLPITFGREVFASLVGKPDRTNWKVCVGAEEEEKARVDKFRRSFGPFDIMNNDDGEENE